MTTLKEVLEALKLVQDDQVGLEGANTGRSKDRAEFANDLSLRISRVVLHVLSRSVEHLTNGKKPRLDVNMCRERRVKGFKQRLVNRVPFIEPREALAEILRAGVALE